MGTERAAKATCEYMIRELLFSFATPGEQSFRLESAGNPWVLLHQSVTTLTQAHPGHKIPCAIRLVQAKPQAGGSISETRFVLT